MSSLAGRSSEAILVNTSPAAKLSLRSCIAFTIDSSGSEKYCRIYSVLAAMSFFNPK